MGTVQPWQQHIIFGSIDAHSGKPLATTYYFGSINGNYRTTTTSVTVIKMFGSTASKSRGTTLLGYNSSFQQASTISLAISGFNLGNNPNFSEEFMPNLGGFASATTLNFLKHQLQISGYNLSNNFKFSEALTTNIWVHTPRKNYKRLEHRRWDLNILVLNWDILVLRDNLGIQPR